MAKVDGLTFGSILIEAKKDRGGVLIFADGTAKRHRAGFLTFDRHEIRRQELEELSQGQPEVVEVVIVGTGTDEVARVAPEAESWAKADNASLPIQPSYDATVKPNQLTEQNKTVVALMHMTR